MSVDSSWDIDQYHSRFEPSDHWELKKEFIVAHKNLIPEDRLVCLAQVYVNMELLGCRYPATVARQVKELSQGLGRLYHEGRQNKLQRTFVKASDAVIAKLRRETAPTVKQRVDDSTSTNFGNGKPDTKRRKTDNACADVKTTTETVPWSKTNLVLENVPTVKKTKKKGAVREVITWDEPADDEKVPSNQNKFSSSAVAAKSKGIHVNQVLRLWSRPHPLAKLILVYRKFSQLEQPSSVLNHSAQVCGMLFQTEHDPSNGDIIATIDGKEYARAPPTPTVKSAKDTVANLLLDKLTKQCCLLEMKKNPCHAETNVETGDISVTKPSATPGGGGGASGPSESVGSKLLKMMGWTGGGLGKEGTGRAEPIEPNMITGRQGLGFSGPSGECNWQFKNKVKGLIQQYVEEMNMGVASREELVFSPNFSKEQRAFIHSQAGKYHLKHTSYGKGDARFLVLCLKLSLQERMLNLLQQGGETDEFTFHMPGTYDCSIFNTGT